jgi:segregation and condensation protein B
MDVAGSEPQASTGSEDWSADAIEQAYRSALAAAEAIDDTLPDGATVDSDVEFAAAATATAAPTEEPSAPDVTPAQVVEALLFVGGPPLTGKRLADLVGSAVTHESIDEVIEGLSRRYEFEGRPYEIVFGEGGYRMQLRAAFQRVGDRVHGYGPKEIKLSQDALEILALVAYRQPISKEQLDECGKSNWTGIVRQLLRRELIGLNRETEDVTYHTTPRFLQVFGLGSLNDLPHPEDLDYR